jgi:TolB-like protein/Tfp pilus assembly protein PilF
MSAEEDREPVTAVSSQTTMPAGAVFLSYASEDVEAAARIASGLRAAGLEVWFDQSELRGGDAWDHRIREQIRHCRLFLPVISAHSEHRDEGYFRREWSLAVDRARDMAQSKAFIVPVVIDGTSERSASVPEKFHELQWTRLPAGDPSPAFVDRVQRLLSSTATPQPVARALESTAVQPRSAPTSSAPAWGSLRPALVGVAGVAVLGIGYLALNRVVLNKHAGPAVAANTASTISPSSVAVLPLANESGDPSQQYFSDGLSEDLITALGQIPGLKVVGRVSSFRFRDSKEDSASIGSKLGVAHLVEGSVRRAGDFVRVSAELINSADGTMQWSERYDRPYKDLFALQDDITRAVAGALKVKLVTSGDSNQAQYEHPPSGSLEAYRALLQGRFYTERLTESDTLKAIDQFTAATRLDPRYALAWSDLAGARQTLSTNYTGKREVLEQARAEVDRALALAPNLAAAHVARGGLLAVPDFNLLAAETEYRRALEIAPDHNGAAVSLAAELNALGHPAEALDLVGKALRDDPLHAGSLATQATILVALGRLDDAEQALRKGLELSPGSPYLAEQMVEIEVQRGDARAALTAAQQVPPGLWRLAALALAAQIGSDRAAADSTLEALIRDGAQAYAYQIAEVYALRNDSDKTFEWLDRAWDNRDSGIPGLLGDPFLARYRSDRRFTAYCRKVGLPVPGEARHTN